ncbi:MAG: hypothetical protein ACRC33_01530 [Gemmataceae bacterium]
MRASIKASKWVVYLVTVSGRPVGCSAVCEQQEWDELERDRPGQFTLVRSGIASEPEAEALARERSGYRPPAPRSALARPRPAKRSAASNPLLGPVTK